MDKKNDRKLMVLSVIVAIIMWSYVMTTTNPSLSKTIRNIPITIRNQEIMENKGLSLVSNDKINTVNVKVTGDRSDLTKLSADDLVANVDLQDLAEGIKTLKVKVDSPTGIRVEEISPSQVNYKIEKIIEKKINVDIKIDDNLKENRIIQINEKNPGKVKISGIRSQMDKVDKVIVRVDKEEYLDGNIHNLQIKPVDKTGKEVRNLKLSDTEMSLSFNVSESKEVSVELLTSGSPYLNYQIKSKEVRPKKIIIKGESKLIDKIDKIYTEKIDIADSKTADLKGEAYLDLPEGVEIYDGKNIVDYRIKIGEVSDKNQQ